MSTRSRWIPAVLAIVAACAALLLGGCTSAGDDAAAESSPSDSTPQSTEPTPSPTAPATPQATDRTAEPPRRCPLTVGEVSSVLGGVWTRKRIEEGRCAYRSDRGAVFVASPVPDDVAGALADARSACASRPRKVPGRPRFFACVEHKEDDLVVGNLVVRGRPWILVIVGTGPDRKYPHQVDAMVALLGAVPR